MTIETYSSTSDFFHQQLDQLMEEHQVNTREEIKFYLVNLLDDHTSIDGDSMLHVPLAQRLMEALETASDLDKLRKYRQLGDTALYASGFLSAYLDNKGISQRYVANVGERAYASASDLAGRTFAATETDPASIYAELAERFRDLASVLDDLREHTACLRTPQDIIKLYDRWRRTKSPILAKRLCAQGVFPAISAHHQLH